MILSSGSARFRFPFRNKSLADANYPVTNHRFHLLAKPGRKGTSMNVVPFELGSLYGNLANAHGLMRIEDNQLCLEFQVQDSLVGLLKSGVKQARIPRGELASVTLQRSWFGLCTRLVIQVTRMETVQDIPGMSQGRLVLSIARKDREAAARLVTALEVPARA
jgi:hypothetical protein